MDGPVGGGRSQGYQWIHQVNANLGSWRTDPRAGRNWGPVMQSFVIGRPGEFRSLSSLSEDILEGMPYVFFSW